MALPCVPAPGDAHPVAAQLYAECVADEQPARAVSSDDAASVRAGIRRLARADGLRIRTARLDDTVVAVRRDAAVWRESAAAMRQQPSPPS